MVCSWWTTRTMGYKGLWVIRVMRSSTVSVYPFVNCALTKFTKAGGYHAGQFPTVPDLNDTQSRAYLK